MLRLFVLAGAAATASANVMGIDFGSEFMKVALVQPGAPLEIVTNHVSKRKTETAVAFVRGERLFGSDAFGMLSRKPEQAYARLTEYLGRDASHPTVEALTTKSYLPTTARFNATRGALALGAPAATTSEYGGGWDAWTPEELVAMVLSYAKDITRVYGGNVVRDAVITVPSYATQLERAAIIAAAELAELRVLSLIEANTAAALQFGLDRKYENKTRVLFYNMGSESAQASVVEYSTFVEKSGGKNKTVGQLEVLGKGWATGAGGFALDLALTELLADGFNKKWNAKKHKGDVRDMARPMAKIRAAARKTKEVLSANEKIPVNIPSLHDDIDFAMTMTRKMLEDAGAAVFDRAMTPIVDALAAANLTVDDIDQVEILGGGVRVPKIQTMLKAFFDDRKANASDATVLGVHINGDEAVALGAAFHGANVSTSFRVRKVGMMDYAPFAVGVSMRNDEHAASAGDGGGLLGFFKGGVKAPDVDPDWHKRATLFKSGARIGGKPRTIAFHHEADIVCELAYDDADALPEGAHRVLAMYNISGIAEFAAEMAKQNTSGTLPRPKVQLSFTLDASGITSLSKAEVSVTEEYEVDAPPPEEKADKKDKKSKKKAAAEEEANATAATDEAAAGENATAAADGDEAAAAADGAADEAKADEAKADEAKADEAKAAEEAPAEEATKEGEAAAAPEGEAAAENATAGGGGASPGKILKKKTHKRALTVTASTDGMTLWSMGAADQAEVAARLAHIGAAEALRVEREGAKNDLEAAIYRVRNELGDREEDIAPVSTEEQREAVSALSATLEEWLYDADAEPAATFREKKADLEAAWGAIVGRAAEHGARPKALGKFKAALEAAEHNATSVWPDAKPWLAALDLDDLVAKVAAARAWLVDVEAAQDAKLPSEDPAFKVSELATKLKPVASLAARLSSKKKPVVANVTAVDVNATADADANANATTDANATDAAEDAESAPEKTDEEKAADAAAAADEEKLEAEMNDEL